MEISFSLRDIIEKNDRVTLPGIGSFYKKRIEGFFDDAKKVFFPPKEIIEFTEASQKEEPETIVSYISNAKNISETSAKYIVQQYIDEIKNSLQSNGKADIKGLGTLKQNGETLILESTNDTRLSSSFFGLPTINLGTPTVAEEKPIPAPPVAENFSLAEQALSVAVTEETAVTETARPKTWLYIVLTIIILALGLQTLYLTRPDIIEKVLNQIQQPQNNETIVPATIDENEEKAKADSIYNQDIKQQLEAQGLEVEKVKDSADIIINQKQVPNEFSIRYEIVISAWRTEAKAKSELKKLRENGIDAHIVDDAGGLMIKISAATFYNKAEAEQELKRIREELNPEAFIIPIQSLK